jgi:universal stress protein family protein
MYELDVDIHVQIGAPADTIVEAAEQRGADLIVIATHGYTGFKRWALGSVADKVLHARQPRCCLCMLGLARHRSRHTRPPASDGAGTTVRSSGRSRPAPPQGKYRMA